jgi:hypothetical protein
MDQSIITSLDLSNPSPFRQRSHASMVRTF